MPKHIVVDGSNIATEGRSAPSLRQLDDAVLSFKEEHPEALITVVVDATFGHRIDPTEAGEFDDAVSNNELVAPPAGAVGRGDAFVLSIANKVGGTVLSNDSYQEFHGQYAWLFDEGRLIGGKPVPHVGWVFVPRIPVRGPVSRKAVNEAKRKPRLEKASKRQAAVEASKPMPVPAAAPPNSTMPKKPKPAADLAPAPATPAPRHTGSNELLPYLSFVERHPLGTAVAAVVDRYSSHGAYVNIDGVIGYLALRMMSDPPPRSAREFVQIGETIALVVESYAPQRRSIDLATPAMATARPPATKTAARKAAKKTVADTTQAAAEEAAKPAKRTRKKAAAAVVGAQPEAVEEPPAEAPKPAKRARKRPAAAPAPPVTPEEPAAPAKPTRKKAAPPPPEPETAPAPKRSRRAAKAPASG